MGWPDNHLFKRGQPPFGLATLKILTKTFPIDRKLTLGIFVLILIFLVDGLSGLMVDNHIHTYRFSSA